MSNSLFVIVPYRRGAVWAFDDEARGLLAEPFVGDVNRMIDHLATLVDGGELTLLFSVAPIPGAQLVLEHVEAEFGGHTYCCRELELTGWLCPAMFRYFETAPDRIYVKAAGGSR